jgi:hypothetical protein
LPQSIATRHLVRKDRLLSREEDQDRPSRT